MFIQNPEPSKEGKLLLKLVQRQFKQIPPHWELFATIAPKRFKMFLEEMNHLVTHENIDPSFFTWLRFYVASHNGFTYCINFNRTMLEQRGNDAQLLEAFIKDHTLLPLDEKHKTLFSVVLQAIDEPQNFTAKSLEALHTIGWNDSDIFDAIDHGTFLFKFSKILKAYMAKV